jgi:hypothetical protein
MTTSSEKNEKQRPMEIYFLNEAEHLSGLP